MLHQLCEDVGSVRKRRRCVQKLYFQNFTSLKKHLISKPKNTLNPTNKGTMESESIRYNFDQILAKLKIFSINFKNEITYPQ